MKNSSMKQIGRRVVRFMSATLIRVEKLRKGSDCKCHFHEDVVYLTGIFMHTKEFFGYTMQYRPLFSEFLSKKREVRLN